ncbi:MAG TPA: ethylbenzene dehydrogenase-related protein [Dehalococcoidia bacterium]|nr:ethylbenzene dehydrogenase-related protein [Dehalococcoidia bacterium]
MKAVKIQLATRTLLNPEAAQWSKVPAEELNMGGTPLQEQPSRYVRTAWAGKPLGAVRFLKVQAAHNGQDVVFRLEWTDETKDLDYGDGSVFPDAAGILFPLNGDAPLQTMGSAKAPVNAWFWRASFPDGRAQNIVAQGLGTVEQTEASPVQSRALWKDGRWRVVFARSLAVNGARAVRLDAERPTRVAFAVWEGSSQERAGLKSFSREWRELVIE